MHVTGKQVAIGLGVVAGAVGLTALLSGCTSEQDADTFALNKFKDFDRSPQDNKWTQNELVRSTAWNHTQEVNTYRVGDYIFGTRQILKTTTTSSMERIFDAAKGNDAVLSLQELRDFSLEHFDADRNGTLNRQERNKFGSQYDTTSRSSTAFVGSEPFSRYSPRNDDYYYPPTGGSGGSIPPWNGDTSRGDDNGNSGPTSPGDTGGYTPPPSTRPPSTRPPSNDNGNSSDNGNPSEDDL